MRHLRGVLKHLNFTADDPGFAFGQHAVKVVRAGMKKDKRHVAAVIIDPHAVWQTLVARGGRYVAADVDGDGSNFAVFGFCNFRLVTPIDQSSR